MPNKIITKILEDRGIPAAELEHFLHPSLDQLAKPEELPGIVEAAEVVLESAAKNENVVIFGDYDCDGVCATAIMSRMFKALNIRATEFLPDRLTEGYGMSDQSVSRMLKENPSVQLVVTVDNGINSVEQIAELKAKGVKVVVTDHHLPGDQLPIADALVDPKVASPKSLENLCGAGVAFLLANRVISEARIRGLYSGRNVGGPMLVLAGLATVTDIMPLQGQNRILVAEALKKFHSYAPIGLVELYLRAARTGYGEMTSRDFGFALGPRINAAGRIASGMQALELIITEDRDIVHELARIIDGYNVERKSIEQRMLEEAMAKVVEGAEAQVIDLPDGHPGVAGIVAARVLERLGGNVPVCVRAGNHGSARAPDWLNIRDAFVACSEMLERFGGHAAAGGFVVKEGKIDDFRNRLCEYCREVGRELPAEVTQQTVKVDAWIDAADITLELADELQLLQPFGEGNPEPVFGIRGVYLADVKPLGNEGRHLSLSLRGFGLRAIQWNRGDLVESLRATSAEPHDIMFTLTISDYGDRHVELRIVSIV